MAGWDLLKGFLDYVKESKWKWIKLFRGLAIFIVSAILLGSYSTYVLYNKLDLRFGLRGFEYVQPPLPTFQQIMFSRVIQVIMALGVIALVMILMLFLRGMEWKLISLITLILHSFIILIIFTAIQFPIVFNMPKASFMIVDARFENVTFYNATLLGVSPEGPIEISSETVNVSYAKVYRGFPNKTIPEWFRLTTRDDVERIINQTKTYMNLSSVKWVERGVERTLEKLSALSWSWDKVVFSSGIPEQYVRMNHEIGFLEQLMGLLSPISWAVIAAYNAIGFRKLYQAGKIHSTLTGILIFVILLMIGVV
ncbi:MAG: hypothetical protein J7J19_06030 [Thaumarchaeota archaeon]|nr:hypothetical protein [Nitrososphaerota archaeon]